MRRATPLALALLLAFTASPIAPRPAAAAAPPAPDAAPTATREAADGRAPLSADGRYIVLLESGSSVNVARVRAGRLGVSTDRVFRNAVRGFSASLTPGQVASLKADPDVADVIPDEVISMAAQSVPTGVRRVNGRESLIADIDGAGPQVDADVAIVDTGIGGTESKSHEDLNIAGGVSCATDNPNKWGDANGHGTHVAGTVGALDNNLGVVGVAPGVRLWAVRILDGSGSGLISWYVCGLDWIAAQRDPLDPSRPLIEAVNMSVAKRGEDDRNCGFSNKDLIHQAICRLVDSGVTVVAAAGNDSFNAIKLKPESYDEVITVSALADTDGRPGGLGGGLCYSWGTYDRDDTFADFSNYGRDVDLIAPGKCIWSTLPGNRYGYVSGTSMAAPHVTGAAALYRSSRPDATPAETRAALIAAGTMDWNTATDPDSIHEPLLDVSHIVALADFPVDATPGTSRSALVGAAGGDLALPVRLFRAEDFGTAVDLSITAEGPLTAALADPRLGPNQSATTMEVTVPEDVPSGTYDLEVTATDGDRVRRSSFPVTVDSTRPTAKTPALALRGGGTLGDGVLVGGTWAAATDPAGTIARYEYRWVVDGTARDPESTGSGSRSVTRRVDPGQEVSLQVRARDAAGNWSSWTTSAGFAPRLTQDTSEHVRRTGRWTRVQADWASGGTTLASKQKGAYVKRSFTGRGIAWIGSKGPQRGKARIYIDGSLVTTVDLHRSTDSHRVVLWTRAWASAGQHSISVQVVGTSGWRRVDVDAFVIVP